MLDLKTYETEIDRNVKQIRTNRPKCDDSVVCLLEEALSMLNEAFVSAREHVKNQQQTRAEVICA